MPPPSGFAFHRRDGGVVVITHRGRPASTLRGARAAAFLAEVDGAEPQLVMARWTGNFKRGNERVARAHPRHRRPR
jgi:hypothetical protein